jgi:hypothetical protein
MAGLGRHDAVMGDRAARPADQTPRLVRGRAVGNQAEQAWATSTMLVERYLRAVAQSLRVSGQAADAYANARTVRQAATIRRRAATTSRDGAPSLEHAETGAACRHSEAARSLFELQQPQALGTLLTNSALRASEVPIDRGAAHPQRVGNRCDDVLPRAIHLLGHLELMAGHDRGAAASPGRG